MVNRPIDERMREILRDKSSKCGAFDAELDICAVTDPGPEEECPQGNVICCAFCETALQCCDRCPELEIYEDELSPSQ